MRLSGEIADQAILDNLRAVFPQASIGHAYASTEAGVAFDVNDGLAGFPASYLDDVRDGVEMKLVDGSLRIRSPARRRRYVGAAPALRDADGFVDTGDMVERRGDRYLFVGRRGGIINIGGLKVHPEEVEAVINRHPQVRMSLVRPKQSPFTGAIVIADVVLKSDCERAEDEPASRTKFWISAATRCRATRFRPPSASCRRLPSPRPASWRGAPGDGASMTETVRNVLVTGASRGPGPAIARKLSAVGYRRDRAWRGSRSKQVTEAIAEAERGNQAPLHFAPFDLGEIDEIPELVKKLRKEFGPLYGLVNNAAVGHDGALAMMHNAKIEQLVRLNTLSPIVLTKYVVRSMMSEGTGRIVNVASIIGFTGYSGLSAYAATKASMIGFTRSLAREVGRLGINVNAVAPGFLDTDMTHGLAGEQRERVVRRSSLRRLADVDDVANAVEFLLGDRRRSISGTVLTVDAGATA